MKPMLCDACSHAVARGPFLSSACKWVMVGLGLVLLLYIVFVVFVPGACTQK